MNRSDLIGTWRLKMFEIEKVTGEKGPWRKCPFGLLIYTNEGTMSVSINSDLIQGKEGDDLNSVLFYSGTYRVEEEIITHVVENATSLSRIGKDLVRVAKLNGDTLTLVGHGDFGKSTVVWQKI